ncbi:MAG TPA: lysophospholipid acyltransferase family protein [Mycobacteriales bacterium]|nr:lysophospholipid acyltransferase family protein [Mycobacteriales bacterium]
MAELVYRPVIAFARGVFKSLDLRFTVEGEEHIPLTGGAVIATNHVGYLDFAFIGYGARMRGKRLVRFLAKKEVFDHKISGPLMRGMRHIAVDRSAGAGSFAVAVEVLKRGELVGMFPEATISESFQLKEFKAGAARMAIDAGVPLIPSVVWGSQRVWTKGRKKELRRNHIPISVLYGEPMHPQPGDDPVAVTEELKARMGELLDRAQSSYPEKPEGPDDSWWLPVTMGGTAPTLDEARVLSAERKAKAAAKKRGKGTAGS